MNNLHNINEENAYKKLDELKKTLSSLKKVLIAFSGGVDSTFLARVAKDVLGKNVVLVTAKSPTYSDSEFEESKNLALEMGMEQLIIESNELEIPSFSQNDPRRCFYCKSELFGLLTKIVKKRGLLAVLDGSTAEDLDDYRPGREAAQQYNVLSPLMQAGFLKDEIRFLSREMKLPTWDKPSYACLASRFPYGTRITEDALKKIDTLEHVLKQNGFSQIRVRYYDKLVRIEVGESEIGKLLDGAVRKRIIEKGKELGFTYITLDMEGYRTGSMNEVLEKDH